MRPAKRRLDTSSGRCKHPRVHVRAGAIPVAVTRVPGTVTDHVTVEGGARYTHAARPIAGRDVDIAEAETHGVRRLVAGIALRRKPSGKAE